MDRKIALKWARALESGEYQQTTGTLRDEKGFCCLGVLCNLHAQEHPEIAAEETNPAEYMGEQAVIPEHVMYWADMRSDSGEFNSRVELKVRNEKAHSTDTMMESIRDLVELNDNYEFDFKKIAAVIRQYSEKL